MVICSNIAGASIRRVQRKRTRIQYTLTTKEAAISAVGVSSYASSFHDFYLRVEYRSLSLFADIKIHTAYSITK